MSEAKGKASESGLPPAGVDFTLGDITKALRRNFWITLGVFAASFAMAAAFGMSRTKVYRANATLQIDPKPPAPLGRGVEGVVELGTGSYWANVEYYNTQHELIRALPVTTATVRELGLHRDAAFLANTPAPPADAKALDLPAETAIQLAAGILRGRLNVSPNEESRLVQVSYDDADGKRAARVLDAVLRNYVKHNVNQAVESTSSAVEWLGEQLEGLRVELSQSELALHEYKLEKQIASLGIDDQAGILRGEMTQLTAARTQVRTQIQGASARVTQLESIQSRSPEHVPNMTALGTSELDALRTDYLASVREKESLLASGKGEQHPQVLAVTGRIRATEEAFTAEVDNIKEGARRELAALRQEEGGLRSLLQEAEKKALELNLMEIEYNRLRRTKDNNEKLYGLLLERSKEAGLTQMLKVNNIQVLAPAATGGQPVEPRMSVILAAGALGGLALGLVLALVREQLDRSIKSAAELESRLHLTPLGTVPHVGALQGRLPTKRRGPDARAPLPELLAHSDPAGGYAECLRSLRTNLLFMAPDQPFRRLLITSAGPSEGKTTVACSLAITMARTGQSVLLIDCDMRRPRLHTIFREARFQATVSESLINLSLLDGADLTTDIPSLSVLPAGPCPPNPTELLHSEAFSHLLERLSKRFDLLILDSPPLVVSDAAIISTKMDGALLVARSRKSHRGDVARAARAIKTVGGNVVGAVLNDAKKADSSYGYGSPYGDGYAPYAGVPGGAGPSQSPQSRI